MTISILLAQQIAQLFLMILMGFLIVKAGLLKDEDSKVLSKIVLYLIIPCVILNAFQVDYTPETVRGLLVAFAASLLMSYIAANGQEITEAMIGSWCDAYERGEFPEGERTVGEVVMGRPPLSAEKTTTVTVKIPVGMKATLTKKAEERGTTMSAYVRSVLANDILAAS